jgi:serine/threonine-protein kinase
VTNAELKAIATALPSYEIGSELGRGGMGVVLWGKHRQLGRTVAIKQLPAALAGDRDVRARFAAEARVLATLDHPHIVPIYDYVERDGLCLLVMEHLSGGTLWSRFCDTGITPQMACAVVMVACVGLDFAHNHGILHRDIKPENLLFTSDQVLKTTDFGIAKVVGGDDAMATSAGEILGTPAYMAPEQAQGKKVGPQADVYATAVMLYELLSGRLPYSDEGGPLSIICRKLSEDPEPLAQVAPMVPPELAEVAMRGLARDPGDRYPTPEALGLAVGDAATNAWGPDWGASASVAVRIGGPIAASIGGTRLSGLGAPATDESSQLPQAGSGRATTVPSAVEPTAVRPSGRRSATRGTGTPGGASGPVRPVTGPSVRPTTTIHIGTAGPVDANDLVPLRQVLAPPAWPTRLVGAAAGLLALMLLVALVGIGSPARSHRAPKGLVSIGGHDPAKGSVSLDLGKPIPVRLTGPAPAGVNAARLVLSVGGLPLIESSTGDFAPGSAGMDTTIDDQANRFLTGGTVTGELELLRDTTVVSRYGMAVHPARRGLASAPGVAAIALTLFLSAYGESLLSPVWRRGRTRRASTVGMAAVGAGVGLLAVALAWVLVGREPLVSTAVVCIALGSASGVCAALLLAVAGRRARARRAARSGADDHRMSRSGLAAA